MTRLFTLTLLVTLTLLGLIAISCSGSFHGPTSRDSTMTYEVGTQAQLDAANQRIMQFKQELLQQGFHEVSVAFSNSKERFILEGKYGTLKNPRVTLWTASQMEGDKTEVGGGLEASFIDEQAKREFDELYKKVCLAVTGHAEE